MLLEDETDWQKLKNMGSNQRSLCSFKRKLNKCLSHFFCLFVLQSSLGLSVAYVTWLHMQIEDFIMCKSCNKSCENLSLSHGISLGHLGTNASPLSMIPILVLTGLNGPIIREAMPFNSVLFDASSFFSPSFFNGGIPLIELKGKTYFEQSKNKQKTFIGCLMQVQWKDKKKKEIQFIFSIKKSQHSFKLQQHLVFSFYM